MPPRGGFILPETPVLAGLRFRRQCHYRRRCHYVLRFLLGRGPLWGLFRRSHGIAVRYRIPVKADPNIVIENIRESHNILVDSLAPIGALKIGGVLLGELTSRLELTFLRSSYPCDTKFRTPTLKR